MTQTADETAEIPDNPFVRKWVDKQLALLTPDRVVWCDGGDAQQQTFYDRGVEEGVFLKLNPEKRPGCYLHRSDPS